MTDKAMRSEKWWKHEVSNAWAQGYEKGRASVKQPEQEPVAWRFRVKADNDMYQKNKWHLRPHRVVDPNAEVQPLYTAPPQREWVGLTVEEATEISLANRPYVVDIVFALEAKLKEKNT